MSATKELRFKNLTRGFLESAERFPSRPALFVNDEWFTYLDLKRWAATIASTILQREHVANPLVAILAYRSLTAYAGILGILGAGKGYVPLNPKFPVERTRKMLDLSGTSVLIVGKESFHQLPRLLPGINRPLAVILPDVPDASDLSAAFPQYRFISSRQKSAGDESSFQSDIDSGAVAYLLFTSGSTGQPKGVPISQSNVRSYVQYTCDRYEVNERDRFSQEFDMTFDLSVHDMFVCWERGACLFSVPEKCTMLPAKFIRDHQLTMWFSVPSVAGVLARTNLLKPGSFPSLRYSLFCGEPLSATCAQLWQEAAPQSIVENLYGPTEATIAISQYRWDKAKSPGECHNEVVPIGWVFQGQQCCVIDSERNVLSKGNVGELCLAGSQVTTGYWNSPGKTEQQFVRLPSTGGTVWYRTGDVVRQREDGCLIYLGRIDHQVKIRGYRVELQEIEAVLRNACGSEQVVAIPWPVTNGSADGVVAFVAGIGDIDKDRALNCCRKTLPEYMVPKRIHPLDELPLNANGKVDRVKLTNMLKDAPR